MKKLFSLSMSIIILLSTVLTYTASAIESDCLSELSDFALFNSSETVPTESNGTIITSSGALKMLALNDGVGTEEKEFTDFYNKDNYDIYGSGYTTANYRAVFSDSQINTGSGTSKLKLNGTSSVTDFNMSFTAQRSSQNQLYAGIAFRLQDSDFRTDTFGTKGYMVFVNSAATEKDVKIIFRRYPEANDPKQSSSTATELLSDPLQSF